ncbi:helix-turn-helix domain-containing protein [Roseomonas populi]|uniref:Helix-turn-helix domain-containing protein n=1 Tax=Roseomonas populi TaxID=3121582 RepID=A0ABT1XE63_9PROT|nr:helix-turn-helix transcriptional regulator [Roseomonas pecuniae]MCR0985728.1 helix-turn-helix domain-containing protein [Roseomonas pecuniae]
MNVASRKSVEAPPTDVVDLSTGPGTRILARLAEQEDRAAKLTDSLSLQQQRALAASTQRSPTSSDVAVGREIRELRRVRRMTQKALARMVGVTGAQLHRYEVGTTRIAASRLIAIANALDIRPDVLIAAGSIQDVPTPPAMALPPSAGDDIAELLQVFCTITDPKRRSALIAVARMMAG